MTIKLNNNLRTAMVTAVPDGGSFFVRTGTQPATADTAPTGTLLVQMDSVYFGAPTNGVKSVTPAVPGTAVATGTAGWGRYSDGSSAFDGTVGLAGSGADFIISATSIVVNGIVTLNTMTVTMPAS